MASLPDSTRMTYLEYVAFESTSSEKHEWVNGEMFAMAGGTFEHARLTAAISGELRQLLKGKPCVSYSSDLRIRSTATEFSSYPDHSVICGAPIPFAGDEHSATNPTLVVEVLSPSTEAYDPGPKSRHYRLMPSVQELLLVSQDVRRLELFRRDGAQWRFFDVGPGESLRLESIDVTLWVDAVYA